MYINGLDDSRVSISFESSFEKDSFLNAIQTSLNLFRNLTEHEIKNISSDFFMYQKKFKKVKPKDFIKYQEESVYTSDLNDLLFLFGFAETFFQMIEDPSLNENMALHYYKQIHQALKNAKGGTS